MKEENKESPLLHTYSLHELYALSQRIDKLIEENKILKQTVEFYVKEDDGGGRAMMTLKKLRGE